MIKNYLSKKFPYIEFVYRKVLNFILYFQYLFLIYNKNRIYNKICVIAKQNKRKIRIAFLVNENEKWCCQSLYDKLKRSNHFSPMIFLTSLLDKNEEKYKKNVEFFKRNCGEIQIVYDAKAKKFESLRKYSPDIVIYQQPWNIAKKQNLFSIRSFALAIYIPYSFANKYELVNKKLLDFHYILFREYISHNYIYEEYKKKGYKKNNLKVVGYPKLEQYLDDENSEKKYVIYAPHHSIEENTIKLGTFNWNGKFILEYAKKHPEFNWIFKPHPFCKRTFLRAKIFRNEKELNDYYDEWSKIGIVYDKGNYIALFKQSKCLITDCGSFLTEFLPSKSPVINLKRTDSLPLSELTQTIAKSYYKVYNIEELKKSFYDVLEKDIDTKKEERLKLIKDLNLITNASDNIIKDLEGAFYK